MFRAKLQCGALLLTVSAAGALAKGQPQPAVAVIQVGSVDGGINSDVRALNDNGVVAGSQFIGYTQVAFIWDHGQYTYLGSINGGNTRPLAINNNDEVVGYSAVSGIFDLHAFFWSNGQMTDLGTLGGDESSAYGISENGEVVGSADFEPGANGHRAFLWYAGEMRQLAMLGGRDSHANDVTSDGLLIVGTTDTDLAEYGHAALWTDPKTVIDLGVFPGDRASWANAINDAGDVVGTSGNGGSESHAFLWRNNTLSDIHQPGVSRYSVAQDINNRGEIVGYGSQGSGGSRAVYWTPQLHMIDLNDIIPPRSGWVLFIGWAINESGQIACQAERHGELIGALVNPVYPTMNLSAPSPGAAGASNTLTVTGVTPGKRIAFLYSKRGGGAIIPGCNLQQNALQLDSPTIVGTATADANGEATITRNVPLIARGQTILFQAVVQNECAISQLVVHEFE